VCVCVCVCVRVRVRVRLTSVAGVEAGCGQFGGSSWQGAGSLSLQGECCWQYGMTRDRRSKSHAMTLCNYRNSPRLCALTLLV
jgi:hypothetical protein